MYFCCDCGREFERPKIYIDRHGLDFPPYERHSGCPYCGSDDYDKGED